MISFTKIFRLSLMVTTATPDVRRHRRCLCQKRERFRQPFRDEVRQLRTQGLHDKHRTRTRVTRIRTKTSPRMRTRARTRTRTKTRTRIRPRSSSMAASFATSCRTAPNIIAARPRMSSTGRPRPMAAARPLPAIAAGLLPALAAPAPRVTVAARPPAIRLRLPRRPAITDRSFATIVRVAMLLTRPPERSFATIATVPMESPLSL